MNITDLMLEDLVNVKTIDKDSRKEVVKPARVVELSPYYKRVGVALIEEDALRWFGIGFPPSSIEPIPLTVEILVKSGFEVQDQGGGRQDVWNGFGKDNENDIEVEFKDGAPFHIKIDGCGCYYTSGNTHYVHEFQHALRQCNTNKVITL